MASVAMAGAQYGFQLLWVVVLSALLAFVAQYLAAKAGILGGKGVISLVEERLGKGWSWVLMVDALLATWLASTILMKALTDTTGLITGVPSPWWAVGYAAFIFLLVGIGGYGPLEWICKALVALVVGCFFVTVLIVGPSPEGILHGLIPRIPAGVDAALMMAGIMGGAVHITIIAMHTYNVNARGWKEDHLKLAWTDTFLSMFIAFGIYSVAIFTASASVLNPQGIRVRHALDLAQAIQPFLGPYAQVVFMAGIWGAVVSTIIPTFLAAAYFLSDKLGWPLDSRTARFRMVVLAGCLLSLLSPLLKGSFLFLLVIMLALGLCGTPLILLILLLLLNRNDFAGQHRNGILLNLLGGICLLVTTFLALRFLLSKMGLLS
jgi:manganese transport protein